MLVSFKLETDEQLLLRKAAEGHDVSIQALSKHDHGSDGLGANTLQAQLDKATAQQK